MMVNKSPGTTPRIKKRREVTEETPENQETSEVDLGEKVTDVNDSTSKETTVVTNEEDMDDDVTTDMEETEANEVKCTDTKENASVTEANDAKETTTVREKGMDKSEVNGENSEDQETIEVSKNTVDLSKNVTDVNDSTPKENTVVTNEDMSDNVTTNMETTETNEVKGIDTEDNTSVTNQFIDTVDESMDVVDDDETIKTDASQVDAPEDAESSKPDNMNSVAQESTDTGENQETDEKNLEQATEVNMRDEQATEVNTREDEINVAVAGADPEESTTVSKESSEKEDGTTMAMTEVQDGDIAQKPVEKSEERLVTTDNETTEIEVDSSVADNNIAEDAPAAEESSIVTEDSDVLIATVTQESMDVKENDVETGTRTSESNEEPIEANVSISDAIGTENVAVDDDAEREDNSEDSPFTPADESLPVVGEKSDAAEEQNPLPIEGSLLPVDVASETAVCAEEESNTPEVNNTEGTANNNVAATESDAVESSKSNAMEAENLVTADVTEAEVAKCDDSAADEASVSAKEDTCTTLEEQADITTEESSDVAVEGKVTVTEISSDIKTDMKSPDEAKEIPDSK